MANPKNKNKLLILIGAAKLCKSATLVVLAFGLHRLLRPDAAQQLHHFAEAIRIDPDNQLTNGFIEKITGLSHRRLNQLSVATLFYALLFAIEGVGLLMRQRWAEYFTVITTGAFLPIEIYELFHHATAVKAGVLIFNLLILAYLLWNLWKTRKKEPPTAT